MCAPVRINGIAEKLTLEFIIRDFITAKLVEYENLLKEKLATLQRFPGAKADFEVREQYRNMKEVLDKYPQVSAYAKEAIARAGVPLLAMSAAVVQTVHGYLLWACPVRISLPAKWLFMANMNM